MAQQDFPGRRQGDAAGPPDEDLRSQFTIKRRDLPAQRGLRHTKARRSGRKTARLGNSAEISDLPGIHSNAIMAEFRQGDTIFE